MILKASRFKLPQDINKNDTRRSSPAASAIMRTTLDKILLQWYNLPNSINFLQFLSCKQQFYIKTIPPLQTSNTIPEKKTSYSKHGHKIILGQNSMVLLYYHRKRRVCGNNSTAKSNGNDEHTQYYLHRIGSLKFRTCFSLRVIIIIYIWMISWIKNTGNIIFSQKNLHPRKWKFWMKRLENK